MKALRKRAIYILLVLFILPVLAFGLWYGRQVRQQNLDHALIEAIKKNETQKAIALLDQGADANATNKPDKSVNFKSILVQFWQRLGRDKPSSQRYSTALQLPYTLAYYKNYDPFGRTVDDYWRPPKYLHNPRENTELIKALLEHGANPCVVDFYDATPLYSACFCHHYNTVKILLQHHADPKVSSNDSQNPLSVADAKTASLLIKYGANINVKDKIGRTALDDATRRGDKDLIALLEAALKKEQAQQKSASVATK